MEERKKEQGQLERPSRSSCRRAVPGKYLLLRGACVCVGDTGIEIPHDCESGENPNRILPASLYGLLPPKELGETLDSCSQPLPVLFFHDYFRKHSEVLLVDEREGTRSGLSVPWVLATCGAERPGKGLVENRTSEESLNSHSERRYLGGAWMESVLYVQGQLEPQQSVAPVTAQACLSLRSLLRQGTQTTGCRHQTPPGGQESSPSGNHFVDINTGCPGL